jgi:phenylalanyl-tRNA synthetase alpha chain
MKNQLLELKAEILESLSGIKDAEGLKELEIKYLGRKGRLTQALRSLVNLSEEERKVIGALANSIKIEIQAAFDSSRLIWLGKAHTTGPVDVTLPGRAVMRGSLHPITMLQAELEDLFSKMGFMVLDGPELESDYYCFEALNIPKHHPARDMHDTFYIDKKNKDGELDLVMRTHTSPVQVRAMQKYGAPFRGIVPGRVFRSEAIDACHEHTFDQMEGLMIGENISISNIVAVIKELLKGIFGREMEVRVRPGFFPFVEPGLELDIRCTICNGSGCPSCKHSGWLELLPAGMIHPEVLRHGGIDPEKYTGFAFGLGLTRLAMMKYGIGDIRMFNSGDLRFLRQF